MTPEQLEEIEARAETSGMTFESYKNHILEAIGSTGFDFIRETDSDRAALIEEVKRLRELSDFILAWRHRFSGHYVSAEDIYSLDTFLEHVFPEAYQGDTASQTLGGDNES
jgi:hypothetical protein